MMMTVNEMLHVETVSTMKSKILIEEGLEIMADEGYTSTSEESQSSDDERSTPSHNLYWSESVLVIGATGESGTEIVRQLVRVPKHPTIYGMTQNTRTVPRESMKVHMKYSEMLIEGDVTKPQDLHRALMISKADTIVLALDDPIMEDTRANAANSIKKVLRHPPFRHVHLIAVSLSCAAASETHHHNRFAGFGKAAAAEAKRQRLMEDHKEQEEILSSDHTIQARTTIVRLMDFPETLSSTRICTGGKCGALGKMHNKLKLQSGKVCTVPKEVEHLAGYVVDEVIHGQNKGLAVSVPLRLMS